MIVMMLLALLGTGAGQPPDMAFTFRAKCEGFSPSAPDGVVISSIAIDDKDPQRPVRCVLRARIEAFPASVINFRLDLPAEATWNGNFLMLGGGGFDGFLSTELPGIWREMVRRMGVTDSVASAFAVGSTDSGHQGRGAIPFFDLSWALGNPEARVNHAERANHLALGAMRSLVRDFYGREAARRYLVGSSNGGRQGLMAAQRYPEDYHGILAMVPAISQNATAANLTALYGHIYATPGNWLDAARIERYTAAELTACDELDGLKDGVIANYRECRFDPGELRCAAGESGDCLTEGQVESLRLFFADKRAAVPFANGLEGYPASARGGDRSEWMFVFGRSFAARDAVNFTLIDNMVKYTITGDPNASVMTHEPERWASQYLAMSELWDTTDPDLGAFARAGGKLILIHGASDYCVSYERTGQYYRMVEGLLGREATRRFLRYFVPPAIGHSMSGPGTDWFPLLQSLREWVEQGRAPEAIIGSKREGTTVRFTRPLCEYGSYARYLGNDPADARSFKCTAFQ